MKKYTVREGSIADYARFIILCIGFWALFFAAVVTTYPA